MKAFQILLVLLITASASAQSTPGWVTLFDGTNLDAFNRTGNANWEIVDKVVQANMGNGLLVTKANYANFELKVEFWVDDDANSGVFIRCSNPQSITQSNAYEVNIYDKRPDQSGRTGAIVDVAKPSAVINTGGKWNTFEISAKGTHLTVKLNGTQTVDVEHKGYVTGPIGLQYAAGTVKFRNVQIRPL